MDKKTGYMVMILSLLNFAGRAFIVIATANVLANLYFSIIIKMIIMVSLLAFLVDPLVVSYVKLKGDADGNCRCSSKLS